jgi:hypothetical protein
MTTLTGMSRKQRQRAARQWALWRRAGEMDLIDYARAYQLTGMSRYSVHLGKPIRLTAVAIEYTKWRERA